MSPGTLLLTALGSAAVAPLITAAVIGGRAAHAVFHPPRQGDRRTPEDIGLAYRSEKLTTTRDGLRLALWVIPGRGPDVVVISHGMGRTKASGLGHVRMLHDAGHSVVAYDLRNHGASDGDRALGDMAERFSSDLADVVAAARADAEVGGGQVGVLAFSFSAWSALHAVPRCEPPAAVVCDSGPALHIDRGLRHLFDLRRRSLPRLVATTPLYRLCRTAFDVTSRAMLAVQDWPTDLGDSAVPLLFIANSRDRVVPPHQVLGVADRYPWAERWVTEHGVHMNALRLDREAYVRRVTGFLAAAFARADADGMTPSQETTAHG